LNSLGTLQLKREQYSKAEDNFRRSLSRLENLYGPNHSDVASVLNNLGVVLLALKKYAEAEPALLRSVHLYRTNQLPATQVADAVFNLARLFYDLERFAESESLLREVVAIRNSHRHRASDEDAIAYEHYALALRRNGRTADAAAAEAQAKSIRTELRYTFKP
jgi:tetratricopeptide (TPR) repeat protein